MGIEDMESWELAKEIFRENQGTLKEGVTIGKIYNRILELKKEVE
jgi:hypothetical protein